MQRFKICSCLLYTTPNLYRINVGVVHQTAELCLFIGTIKSHGKPGLHQMLEILYSYRGNQIYNCKDKFAVRGSL